ncbi:MAG: efflux RND transporter periplasmic adaptor subunit [Bryobacterales bacterium]|nr:efflux RND transporter periplasmic adaptor subunit [Bryobacterales bacterium]
MSRRGSDSKASGHAGSIAIFGLGLAIGYAAYPWLPVGRPGAATPDARLHDAEEHDTGGADLIHIPIEVQRARGLAVRPTTTRDFESLLQVTGTVSADNTRVSRIRPLARGIVEQVFVQLGDRVNAGDPLVTYDNIDLGLAIGDFLAANAELRSARTALEVNATILARSREMLEFEAVARTEHNLLEAEYRSTQALVEGALAKVAKFEEQLHRFGVTDDALDGLTEASDPDYHRTVSRATLRTPTNGIVTGSDVARGTVVDPSNTLFTVTDLSVVWVLADVAERDISAIRLGKRVSVGVASYRGEAFSGRIEYIGDILDPESRTARVRCVVQNPDGRLKLGMFASVDIPSGAKHRAVAVPHGAALRLQGSPVVLVQRSEDEFEARPIETGRREGDWVETSGGIRPGELVLAADAGSVLEGLMSGIPASADQHSH